MVKSARLGRHSDGIRVARYGIRVLVVALRGAMDALGDTFRAERLLSRGGAAANRAFLKARLIDGISVFTHQAVDGLAGAPTIFEYEIAADELPDAGQALPPLATETLERRMVWLRYAVEPEAPSA